MLAQLANGSVLRNVISAEEVDTTSLLGAWLSEISRFGLRPPDSTNTEIQQGRWTVDALYRSNRALVIFSTPEPELLTYAEDRGYTIIQFSDNILQWPEIFAANPEIFGPMPTIAA